MKNPLTELRQILSAALQCVSESPAIIEEIHGFILDCFKDDNIIQHYDDNPDRHDAVVAAVILHKILPTPAPTPRSSTVSPQTSPRRIIQEFEGGPGSAIQHTTSIASGHHEDEDASLDAYHGSEGVHGRGQPRQECYEAAEGSISKQAAGNALHLATPVDCVLANIDGVPEDLTPQREGRLSRQAAQVAATLISQQLDTPNYGSRKRKHAPEVSDASNSALITASDAAVTGTENPGPNASRLLDSPSLPSPNDDSNDEQPHVLRGGRGGRGCIPVSPATASLSLLEGTSSPAPSPREGQSPLSNTLSAEFAPLKEELRAKGPMIGDEETVEYLWHVVNYIRTTSLSTASYTGPDIAASITLATDKRNRVLGIYITREEQNDGRLRLAKSLSGLRKRLYLVELIGNYIDEHEAWNAWKSQPRKKRRKTKGRLSPLSKYADLLFPETIGWKDTRPGETEASKVARAALREQATNRLKYWISLGEPLVMLTRRYGIGILAVLPKKLTDKILHDIRVNEMDIFVNYIALLHPDLKERLRNLSDLLLIILQNWLPPGKLVFETYTANRLSELHDRSLNELFQFTTSEDTQRVDTIAEARPDQMNTTRSSTLSIASFGAEDEHLMDSEAPHSYVPQTTPQGQPYQAKETVCRPDPSTSESLSSGSPTISLEPIDPIESVSEDVSVEMYPYDDPSQPTFQAVLHDTPPTPTMELGLGANYPTWNSDGGADTRFHDTVQFINLDHIYLSSPIVSPTLPPLPQTTADDFVLHDQSSAYSDPFFL